MVGEEEEAKTRRREASECLVGLAHFLGAFIPSLSAALDTREILFFFRQDDQGKHVLNFELFNVTVTYQVQEKLLTVTLVTVTQYRASWLQ